MNKIKLINNTNLKLIAAFTMIIDHMGVILFPNVTILRSIGRLAFPIFAFCIAEGYYYTRNKYIYLLKLFSFGIITEPIFDLAFNNTLYYPKYQNVLFTFFLSILFLMICERLNKNEELKKLVYYIPQALLYCIFVVITYFVNSDYSVYGFTLVLLFYALRKYDPQKYILVSLYQALTVTGGTILSIFSNIILLFYNNQKGANLKYFFYVFYPLHLLILFIISKLI